MSFFCNNFSIIDLQQSTKGGLYETTMKTNTTNIIRNEFSRTQWNHICLVSKMGKGETGVYVNGNAVRKPF